MIKQRLGRTEIETLESRPDPGTDLLDALFRPRSKEYQALPDLANIDFIHDATEHFLRVTFQGRGRADSARGIRQIAQRMGKWVTGQTYRNIFFTVSQRGNSQEIELRGLPRYFPILDQGGPAQPDADTILDWLRARERGGSLATRRNTVPHGEDLRRLSYIIEQRMKKSGVLGSKEEIMMVGQFPLYQTHGYGLSDRFRRYMVSRAVRALTKAYSNGFLSMAQSVIPAHRYDDEL